MAAPDQLPVSFRVMTQADAVETSRSWSPTAARSTWGWACGPTVMMARAEAGERDSQG